MPPACIPIVKISPPSAVGALQNSGIGGRVYCLVLGGWSRDITRILRPTLLSL